ncbi:MAG: mandelate racemase/muconate lactonizing enzyme family protein [Actinomycetota bacterium]|nr:mandelate racemase/muconate lactonizing enzyme family protein [Actinomycetota bacterium]
MRITQVRATGLSGATPKGGWSHELRPSDVAHTLIEVITDEGLVGLGSASTTDALVQGALKVLQPLYERENALEPQRVTEKLHQNSFWLGRGGAITHTISGIDIALWDLLGQATAQPVGRLLGGRYRERVRPYASVLAEDTEPLIEHLLELKKAGFRAFKVGWGPFGRQGASVGESIVAAARDAVGPDAALMVDAGASDAFWKHGYKWALRTAQMLDDYAVKWFEEPLLPDALDDYVALRRVAPVHIAGGEVFTRRQPFEQWLAAGAWDIVQPDVTKAGGISEVIRIGWAAQRAGTRMIPHGWNTAIGLAVDLQLASAFPDTDMVEYATGSAYIDDIVVDGWHLDDEGFLPIPSSPGLGVQLDRDAVRHHSIEGPDPLF